MPSLALRSVILLTAGLALLLPDCSPQPPAAQVAPAAGSPVLARVGGTVITTADLLEEARQREARRQPVLEKALLLQALVDRSAALHQARASGLDQDPKVKRSMENLLIAELRQRELEGKIEKIEVSHDEVQAAYEARAASFATPAKTRLAILHLQAGSSASPEKSAETRARLEEARAKALSDPAPGGRSPAAGGFGPLSVDYSDDQVSRYRGGDAGWFVHGQEPGRWPETVLQAGFALTDGDVSPVIAAGGDFYLVRKTGEIAAATTPVAEAAPAIRQQLITAKRTALENAYREQNSRAATVELISEALAQVTLPGKPPAPEPQPPALPDVRP